MEERAARVIPGVIDSTGEESASWVHLAAWAWAGPWLSRGEEPGYGGDGGGGEREEPPAGARGQRQGVRGRRGSRHRVSLEHQPEHVLGGVSAPQL